MKNQISLVLIIFVFIPSLNFAQGKQRNNTDRRVLASLVDDVTLQPVPDVKVTILWAQDSSLITTAATGNGRTGYKEYTAVNFYINKIGDYIAKCEAPGYETTYNNFTITKIYKHESNINLERPFYIKKLQKKKEHTLGEVTVRATKVKFYYKGDTVVYNADAFELAEGSMLDALIKQLPGVELKESGEITVNGQHVDELLLNGRDFLNSDRKLMLQNLPSYMVKNIKVYERADLLSEKVGKKNVKKLAMDVRLKKEYSIGLIGNTEAGIGTHDRFLGRLFGLRFTPNSSLLFWGNANNLSDDRTPGDRGDWTPMQQPTGITKSYSAGAKYQYQSEVFMYNGDAKVSYSDGKRRTYTNSENFITTANQFGRSFANTNSDNTSISTNHIIFVLKDISLSAIDIKSLQFFPSLQYNRYSNNSQTGSATADSAIFNTYGHAWRDSITTAYAGHTLRTYGLNRIINNAKGRGHNLHTGTKWNLGVGLPHNDYLNLYFSGNIDFTDSKSRQFEHYNLEYLKTGITDFRNRFDRNGSTGFLNEVSVSPGSFYFYHKIFLFSPSYTYTTRRQSQSRSLFLLNKLNAWGNLTDHPLGELPSVDEMLLALDRGNTYHQRQNDDKHNLYLRIEFGSYRDSYNPNKIYLQGNFDFNFNFEKNRLIYKRASIDTSFSRHVNVVDFKGNVSLFRGARQNRLQGQLSYSLRTQAPNMTYLVDYRDDSDPLNVMLGNRHLKNTHTHTFGLSFNRNMKKQRILETSLGAHIFTHRLSMGYVYDRETGVRTVTPDNVNGNWDISVKLKYSARLDKDGRFTYSTQTDATCLHSVDLIGEDGAAASSRSKVNTTYLNEALKLNMRLSSKATINLLADLHYQHSSSSRKNFSTINVYDFDYGLGGIFSLPWKLKLSTDLTMYSRRGYSDHSMNTNEPVWNARLSRPFWNGRLTVMLDAFDLLNELSNVRRTINAQGRTETWNNVTPHYVMIHALFRLNKEPKKK